MNAKKEDRKRDKWRKFCPKCGKPTDEFFDSICKDCYRQGITLLEPESLAVSLSVCPHCGCFFKGKERTSIEAVIENAVPKAIQKMYGSDCAVEITELRTEREASERRARAFVNVKAEINGVDVEESAEVTVILKRGTCERCSRIAGGYYAAIVQIRAKDRIPTDNELIITEDIAYSTLGEADFVSKEQMLREGLDIYVSSAECGRRISRAIVKKLGGSFSESNKLYGRKDGREIYRVTFLVRLPELRAGEIVAIDGKEISIHNVIEGKGIEGVDITTGERVFVSKKELLKAKRV